MKVTTTPTPTVIANPGTPVKVTLPSGKEVIATIKNGITYMSDNSRPEAGSIVHTSDGDYKMTTSGVGVLVPTTKNTTSANTTAQTGQIGVTPKPWNGTAIINGLNNLNTGLDLLAKVERALLIENAQNINNKPAKLNVRK